MRQLSETGLQVLERRYLKRNDDGEIIETPEELFRRVAHAVAGAEIAYANGDADENAITARRWEDKFYNIMSNLDFLPNSPTLMNAGMPLGQLSACFVLPISDSIQDIFNTVRDTAIIHKSGGGTGFSFSRIRPNGAMVSTTKGKASGPLSFMHAFDAATGTIAQGGKRRGANMGLLRVDHPDIMEFITVKNDLTQLNNFNLSVGITEKFMNALHNKGSYELIDPNSGKVTATMEAETVWKAIIHSAWKTGEPGIIFLDRINETNFLRPLYGDIEATNPCLLGNTTITIKLENGEIVEREIESLVGQEVDVWTGYEWSRVTPKKTGEHKPIMTILFSNGRYIRCTPNHKFLMATSLRKTADQLEHGDVLAPWHLPDAPMDSKDGESVYVSGIYHEEGTAPEVFCLTEPIRHAFMANGVVVGNCGEQPLLPYEACNLGSINLANFVCNVDKEVHTRTVDYKRLQEVVRIAVRFLDDVIDVNEYPLPEIRKMCLSTRKIGLGVMGFADMLHLLHIPYDSEEGINTGKAVMKLIQDTAHDASRELGIQRGIYPAGSELLDMGCPGVPGRRNAMVTTIAPTGSISAIAGVSSGIEPLFANVFYKHYMDDDYHPVVNEHLLADLHAAGVWTEELEEKIKHSETIAHMEEIPEHLRRVYVCSHDIQPMAHIQMQAVFQQNVDNAISKTVNFVESATEDDIERTYNLAYTFGCKGVTVYRNNCRKNQVLNIGTVDQKDKLAEFTEAVENWQGECGVDRSVVRDALRLIAMSPNACKLIMQEEGGVDIVKQAYHNIGHAIDGVCPGSPQDQKESIDSNQLHPDLVYRALCEYSEHDAVVHKHIDHILPETVLKNLYDHTLALSEGRKPLKAIYVPDGLTDKVFVSFMRDVAHQLRPDIKFDSILKDIEQDQCACGGNCTCGETAPAVKDRPESLEGKTKCVKINCGKLYVTVNHDELNQLFEVFTTNGKGGGCPAQSEAVCRLASLLLRSGVTVDKIIRQLRGIKCTACLKNPDIHVLSCPDAIGRELESESKRLQGAVESTVPEHHQIVVPSEYTLPADILYPKELLADARMNLDDSNRCPQCGAEMHHEGGCMSCLKCGFSNCG